MTSGFFSFKFILRIPLGPSSYMGETERQISQPAEKTQVHSKWVYGIKQMSGVSSGHCTPEGKTATSQVFLWHKENFQLMLNMCKIKNIMRMMANAISIAEQTASLLCQNQQRWPQGSAVIYLILRISSWVINLSAVHNSWQLLFSANTLYVFLVTEHSIFS